MKVGKENNQDRGEVEINTGENSVEVEERSRSGNESARSRRLAALKASIEAGTYHVAAAPLADSLTRHMLRNC